LLTNNQMSSLFCWLANSERAVCAEQIVGLELDDNINPVEPNDVGVIQFRKVLIKQWTIRGGEASGQQVYQLNV